MNTQQQKFRYSHLAQPRMIKDVRSKRTVEINLDQCYFLGFRISVQSGYLYHHAVIIADDWDSFLEGVAGEYNAILNQSLVSFTSDIAPVYVRSMMTLDPAVIDCADRENINKEIREGLARRDDDLFIVSGLVGDDKIGLMQVTSHNALTALESVRVMVSRQHSKTFTTLEVSQAHPVTSEFNALFKIASDRIMALATSRPKEGSRLH